MKHQPVLLNEAIAYLQVKKGGQYLDATAGLGGHARAILEALSKTGHLIVLEKDEKSFKLAQENLVRFGLQVIFLKSDYRNLADALRERNIGRFDGILFDLGLSSYQLGDASRGFSFLADAPLDMRFDQGQSLTAGEVVNRFSERELVRIFQEYGEERRARVIARKIVQKRRKGSILTTKELSRLAMEGTRRGRIHPATRVFQALRIFVNDELGALQEALPQALGSLKKGGRLVVISYHSLEDRIVKHFFRREQENSHLKVITKKPIVPQLEEIKSNPRSRSAKLRAAEKI